MFNLKGITEVKVSLPIGWHKIQSDNIQCWRWCGATVPFSAVMGCELAQRLWRGVWQNLVKLTEINCLR